MNQRQISIRHMIDATLGYLELNALVWESVPKIGAAKNELQQISFDINEAAAKQENAKRTFGKTKIALKTSIAKKADEINDVLEVYANLEGNDELARKMSDTKTDLYRLNYNDFFIKVDFIIKKAEEVQEDLITDYGLTVEQLDALKADIDQLLEINGQPRAYQIQSVVATKELEQLLADAMVILTEQLDKLMKLFSSKNSSFYIGYQKARMIVD